MTVAGVVLAAGEGRRFGGPKAVARFAGERLVVHPQKRQQGIEGNARHPDRGFRVSGLSLG